MKNVFPIVMLFLILQGCNKPDNKQTDMAVAEVAGKVLYKSDLARVLPQNDNNNLDSAAFIDGYITKWIKQQLLVNEAEHSLSPEELNIDDELEKYREELLIYKYKNKRISNLSDNEIPDSEIKAYYQKNSKTFILSNPVVRVKYIIFPPEVELPATFRQQLLSTKDTDKSKTEDFILKFAKKYDNFNGNWIYFNKLTELMDNKITNPGKYLKSNQLIEFTTSTDHHLIVINDYRLKGEQAPLEFVAPRIKSLLLNTRKLNFLREIKDSLYNNALKYNKFKVFN